MRVLLLADSHLGFDDPLRPRVQRRRRGPDFTACYELALQPALRGEADLVVHGGDLLHRSRAPASVVHRALEPLRRVADAGVPVLVVPGNHERSRIPCALLAQHPRIRVFHRPATFRFSCGGVRAAVSGFPFVRRVGGANFPRLLEETGWREHGADVRLLCMHQAVEGARVGVHDYTFREGRDVVAARALPAGFAAVLCGHIHRCQVLRRGLAAPVLYPGSVERTSFVEREERKGYLLLRFAPAPGGGRLAGWRFVPLPARPMAVIRMDGTRPDLEPALRDRLAACRADAVVRVDLDGAADLSARDLRSLAPATMNVALSAREPAHAAGRP